MTITYNILNKFQNLIILLANHEYIVSSAKTAQKFSTRIKEHSWDT